MGLRFETLSAKPQKTLSLTRVGNQTSTKKYELARTYKPQACGGRIVSTTPMYLRLQKECTVESCLAVGSMQVKLMVAVALL